MQQYEVFSFEMKCQIAIEISISTFFFNVEVSPGETSG